MTLTIQDDESQSSEPKEVVHTTLGAVNLPIRYRDGSLSALFYRVAPGLASELLPADFVPLEVAGKALVILCGFEYRDTTIGLYNEVGLAVWVKRPGSSPSSLRIFLDPAGDESQATYIVSLPVTTEKAYQLGVQIWGLPKYVAPIRTDFSTPNAEVVLEGELSWLQGRSSLPRIKGTPLVLFSRNKGRLLRTIIPVDHRIRWGGARRTRLTLLGPGPTADKVRFLGLHQLRPWAAFRTDELSSRLGRGKDLGAAGLRRQRPQPTPTREGHDEGN